MTKPLSKIIKDAVNRTVLISFGAAAGLHVGLKDHTNHPDTSRNIHVLQQPECFFGNIWAQDKLARHFSSDRASLYLKNCGRSAFPSPAAPAQQKPWPDDMPSQG